MQREENALYKLSRRCESENLELDIGQRQRHQANLETAGAMTAENARSYGHLQEPSTALRNLNEPGRHPLLSSTNGNSRLEDEIRASRDVSHVAEREPRHNH